MTSFSEKFVDSIDRLPRVITVPAVVTAAALSAYVAQESWNALLPYVQNGGLADPTVLMSAIGTTAVSMHAGFLGIVAGRLCGRAAAGRLSGSTALNDPIDLHVRDCGIAPAREEKPWRDDEYARG